MSKSEGPRIEVPNLEEVEREREKLRKKLRPWHLIMPMNGDDLRAYRQLLSYARPYRMRILASISIALLAAGMLGLQLFILDHGLGAIFGGAGEQHVIEGQPYIVKPRTPDSKFQKLLNWWDEKGEAAPASPDSPADAAPDTHRAHYEIVPADSVEDLAAINEADREERSQKLWIMAVALVIAVLIQGISKYFQAVLMASASQNVVVDLRLATFRHIMGLSVRFHQKNHSAQLVSRVTHELEIFGRFLTEVLIRLITNSFEFIACIWVIAINQGSFIFVVGAIVAAGAAPIQAIGRKLRRQDRATKAGMAEVYTRLSESFTGQRVIKAFSSEEREYDRFRVVARNYLRAMMRVRRLRSLTEPTVMTIGAVGTSAIIVVGGNKVLSGEIEPSTFMVMIIAIGRAMASMRVIGKQFTDFQLGLAAADRVGTLLATRSDIEEKADAIDLPAFHSEIHFDHVSFYHDPEKATITDLDLRIRRGEKVALVGASGAGKSTIADLLPRFFDVDEGAIRIDGHDIRDLTLYSLRSQIGIVAQETILFGGTIRDNIAYGRPDATDEDVVAAAQAANAHSFIEKAPQGYDTYVGERGYLVSGGERQRLAIARALLKNPPILILDEATSALDSESEVVVQAALQNLMSHRTVVVIAHRLSTVRDADRIVVLDKGIVVEIGSHDELMAREGGAYQRLHNLQLHGLETAEGDPAAR